MSQTWLPAYSQADETLKDIQVNVQKGPRGSHHIEGRFTVKASSKTAWDVLTDYNRLSSFVSSIKLSREVNKEKQILVEQIMTGQAALFRKKVHVILEIEEKKFQTIVFHDTLNRSFKSYSGRWEMNNSEDALTVTYHLDATPNFFSPDFIALNAFKKNVKLLLEELGKEILKRETSR